jgi:hypothetical protein
MNVLAVLGQWREHLPFTSSNPAQRKPASSKTSSTLLDGSVSHGRKRTPLRRCKAWKAFMPSKAKRSSGRARPGDQQAQRLLVFVTGLAVDPWGHSLRRAVPAWHGANTLDLLGNSREN